MVYNRLTGQIKGLPSVNFEPNQPFSVASISYHKERTVFMTMAVSPICLVLKIWLCLSFMRQLSLSISYR